MTLWTIALNDLKQTFKDRMFFFWLLVFPLLFAFIFGTAFSESEEQDRKVTLNVLDHDQSFLSPELVSELESEKYAISVLENETERGYMIFRPAISIFDKLRNEFVSVCSLPLTK